MINLPVQQPRRIFSLKGVLVMPYGRTMRNMCIWLTFYVNEPAPMPTGGQGESPFPNTPAAIRTTSQSLPPVTLENALEQATSRFVSNSAG